MKISEAAKVEEAHEESVQTVEDLQAKLKPGDVLFTAPIRSRMKSAFGKYVFKPLSRFVQGTDYGHSSIYVGDGHVIEARIGEGTRKRSLNAVALKNNIIVLRPDVPPEERKKAVEYALEQEGVPYDSKKLVATALPFRDRRKSSEPEKADAHICSALVANAYARRKFSDFSRLLTRPSEIMRSSIMKPVAALEKKP